MIGQIQQQQQQQLIKPFIKQPAASNNNNNNTQPMNLKQLLLQEGGGKHQPLMNIPSVTNQSSLQSQQFIIPGSTSAGTAGGTSKLRKSSGGAGALGNRIMLNQQQPLPAFEAQMMAAAIKHLGANTTSSGMSKDRSKKAPNSQLSGIKIISAKRNSKNPQAAAAILVQQALKQQQQQQHVDQLPPRSGSKRRTIVKENYYYQRRGSSSNHGTDYYQLTDGNNIGGGGGTQQTQEDEDDEFRSDNDFRAIVVDDDQQFYHHHHPADGSNGMIMQVAYQPQGEDEDHFEGEEDPLMNLIMSAHDSKNINIPGGFLGRASLDPHDKGQFNMTQVFNKRVSTASKQQQQQQVNTSQSSGNLKQINNN